MPKEVIAFPRCEEANEWNEVGESIGKIMATTPRLTLHWSALHSTEDDLCGGVQLSVACYPPTSLEEYKAARSWPPEPLSENYTENLTRDQLNRLIRLLRRARDAAYGGDE